MEKNITIVILKTVAEYMTDEEKCARKIFLDKRYPMDEKYIIIDDKVKYYINGKINEIKNKYDKNSSSTINSNV